jgi:hypothetical protein
MQAGGHSEGVLPADRDQGVEAFAPEVLEHAIHVALLLVRVRSRGAEDGSTPRQDPRDLTRAQGLELPLDETAPALADTDHPCAALQGAPGDRPDDGVQTGTIASTRQDADSVRH